MDKETEAKLRAEHGDLIVVKFPGGRTPVFRVPTQPEYEDFQEKLAKDRSNKTAAIRELCMRCLVHPEPDDLELLFKRYPASAPKISDQLATEAGAEVEITVKKG